GNDGGGYYRDRVAELSAALAAFYGELTRTGEMARVTVVVQSEFGRRVRENGSGGTDHGYGNPLLVLGGPVNGGRFYGTWAGLHPETLSPYFGDIPVTTDYRRVFAELLHKRMGHATVDQVLPGFGNHTPLGLFAPASAAAAATPRAVAPGPVRPRPRHLARHGHVRARRGPAASPRARCRSRPWRTAAPRRPRPRWRARRPAPRAGTAAAPCTSRSGFPSRCCGCACACTG